MVLSKTTALRTGLLTAALVLLGALGLQGSAWAIERGPLNQALLATVRVIVPIAAEKDTYSTGSGTILTESGLILTNYHVMGDIEQEKLYNSNGFAAIAINPTNLRSQPILKYAAFLVAGSPELDLALLRIGGLLEDANAPLPENLGLTAIPIGDSTQMQIGDEINAFGFPSIGGDTVTFTSGVVSGFEDQDQDGYAEWLKVDLNINHGNSGGLATNEKGEFVGVPTQGRTDMGMIGFVRDGNLALEWVRRVLVGNNPEDGKTDPNAPAVRNVQFAKAVNPQGVAISPSVRFPSGSPAIYATFDYANFPENGKFAFSWYRDGFEIFSDSVVWTFGKDGSTWVNIYDEEGLADGYYELEMTLDGTQLFRDGVVVGEAQAQPQPEPGGFGPIIFAKGVSDENEPIEPGTNFSGVDAIYAFFSAQGVANGSQWGRRWYIDGELVASKDDVWNQGDVSSTWISLGTNEGVLPVGRYRLELLLEGKVVQTGEMDVVEPTVETPVVREVTVVGTVVEADNRKRAVVGAAIFFLNPGVKVSQFLDDPTEEQVFAKGVSNEEGFYQLDKKLTPGAAYSVVVYKEGYRLVAVDDYPIPADATSPWEINVTMERQ